MLVLALSTLHLPERTASFPSQFFNLLQPGKIDHVISLGNLTSPTLLTYLGELPKSKADFHQVRGEFDESDLPTSLVFQWEGLKVGIINGWSVIPKDDPLALLSVARMMDVDVLLFEGGVEAYTVGGKFFVSPGSGTGVWDGVLHQEEKDNIAKALEARRLVAAGELEKDKNRESSNGKSNEPVEHPDGDSTHQLENSDPPSTLVDTDANKTSSADTSKEEIVKDSNKDPLAGLSVEEIKTLATQDISTFMSPLPSFCLLDIKGIVCTLYFYTLVDEEVKIDKLTYRKED